MYNSHDNAVAFSHVSTTHELTQLLVRWANGDKPPRRSHATGLQGDPPASGRPSEKRAQERHAATAPLVHEAYVRLVDQTWRNRSHFFGVPSQLMRRILVDHARKRQADKRAGQRVSLENAVSFQKGRSRELLTLDSGLTGLQKLDPRKCRAVELRYFGGLSMEEIAQTLDVSAVKVRRDLRMAEAWLNREMGNR